MIHINIERRNEAMFEKVNATNSKPESWQPCMWCDAPDDTCADVTCIFCDGSKDDIIG